MKPGRRAHLSWMLIALLLLPCLVATAVWVDFSNPQAGQFPPISYPKDNQPSEIRSELGRKLFFDPVLSVDSTVSCGSCHHPRLAFSDSVPVSPGVQKRLATRNAPPLFNVAYRPRVLRDGGAPTLEMQVLVPVQEHAELDFNLLAIADLLNKDSLYVALSLKAYNRKPDPFVVTRALAAYQRTLVSQDSEWDRFMEGGDLSPRSAKGMKVFRRIGCDNCHSGPHFADFEGHNNGLKSSYPDSGKARLTHLQEDVGIFITPSLRNLSLTAPYMHDGSLVSLEEVLDHYQSGGKGHRNQDPRITPFHLSMQDRAALLHFLRETLLDRAFVDRHLDDATRPLPAHLLPARP